MKTLQSKIEKLISELCPNGVEFKDFSDIAEYVRGVTYGKNDEIQTDDGWRILRSNNINLSSNTLNFNDVKFIAKTAKIREKSKN